MSDIDRTRDLLEISCADAMALMTDYLDKALAPADVGRLEAHLRGCVPCSVFLDQLRKTIVIAGEIGTDELPVEPKYLDSLLEAFRHGGSS